MFWEGLINRANVGGIYFSSFLGKQIIISAMSADTFHVNVRLSRKHIGLAGFLFCFGVFFWNNFRTTSDFSLRFSEKSYFS